MDITGFCCQLCKKNNVRVPKLKNTGSSTTRVRIYNYTHVSIKPSKDQGQCLFYDSVARSNREDHLSS